MNPDGPKEWTSLDFVFADETHLSFEVRLSDSFIIETAIDPGLPDLRQNRSMSDLLGIDELLFIKDDFPHFSLWYKYAQLAAAEKCLKYTPLAETELLRIVLFEYLRIAEYLFCLATFALNTGTNEVYAILIEKYYGLSRFLKLILDQITPFEIVCGLKRLDDLPPGFIEKNLNFLTEVQPQFETIFRRLLGDRIVIDSCRMISVRWVHEPALLNGGPNQRATGFGGDRRYDFPYSCYHKLYFDPTRISGNHDQTWQRLKIRCMEIFTSLRLIRQAVLHLTYEKPSRRPALALTGIPRGHASSIIETPWGILSCQMNFSGLREPCEFIMTNLQYGLRLYLRQAAVGLEPGGFSLLVASLGLRPD